MSVESNRQWYERVERLLRDKGIRQKVDLRCIPVDDVNDVDSPDSHPYADIVQDIPVGSLDFALVDGAKMRVLCMEKVIPKIKTGGLLILDNAERFFPNSAMGQHTVAITPRDRCLDARWEKLWDFLGTWRGVITTNGVTDTRFFVNPGSSVKHRGN